MVGNRRHSRYDRSNYAIGIVNNPLIVHVRLDKCSINAYSNVMDLAVTLINGSGPFVFTLTYRADPGYQYWWMLRNRDKEILYERRIHLQV